MFDFLELYNEVQEIQATNGENKNIFYGLTIALSFTMINLYKLILRITV